MKKFIIFLMCLLMACNISQPTQVPGPDTETAVIGLQDIPITNMPGHAPPEVPLECICPKMFGLDHNPCCPTPKPKVTASFAWYDNPLQALLESKGEKTILVLFVRNPEDADAFLRSLEATCAREILDKYYVGLLLRPSAGEKFYDMLRSTSELPLKWYPGDFFMSPSVMFVKTELSSRMGDEVVLGRALPITFEGKISANVCSLLEGMHTVGQ